MPTMQDGSAPDGIRDEVQDLSNSISLQSDKGHNEEARQRLRKRAKDSLYFFCKGVLGYPDLTKNTHKEYADFLQDLSKKRELDLMPRGVYKTTIGTIGFAIWYLLHYPNHFILIANQTSGNAERMLLEIEGHLDGSNPVMNWLFPEMIMPHNRWKPWSSTKMTIPNRRVVSGTPSITALGVGAKAESQHFHVIINDDLIGDKAQASRSIMLDAIAWHDYSESLFVSPRDGIERMHGTRWGLSDLYSFVLKRPEYDIYEKSAVDDDGNLLFPELLDAETVRRLRERNYLMFMSQYMNKPMNTEALDFNIDWLTYFKLLKDDELGPYCSVGGVKYYVKDMDVAMFVDPAGSGDAEINMSKDVRRAQYQLANNAVGVWGLHGCGKYFLLDIWVGRARGENPELQVASKMLEMLMRWRGYARKGYVEAYGAQRALITIFNMLCKQNKEYFIIEEIGRGNIRAKKVRIRTYIGGPAQEGLIHVRRHQDIFIKEFTEFPQSDTFDTLDMSAWAFSKLRKPNDTVEDELVHRASEKRRKRLLVMTGRAGY